MSELNRLTEAIIGAAIEVHRRLGPGLLETAYRKCLAYELRKRGFEVVEEQPIPVVYDEVELECGFRTRDQRRMIRARQGRVRDNHATVHDRTFACELPNRCLANQPRR